MAIHCVLLLVLLCALQSIGYLFPQTGVRIELPSEPEIRDDEISDYLQQFPTTINGRVTPVDPTVAAGSTLRLTCTLNDPAQFNSSHLKFVIRKINTTDAVIPERFYSRPNSRTLSLVYPNISTENSGSSFQCRGPDRFPTINAAYVTVGYLPDNISKIDIVTYNRTEVNIRWCSNQDLVFYTIAELRPPYCTPNDSFRNVKIRYSRCWNHTFEYKSARFCISINGSNKLGSTVNTFKFTPDDHVKPGKVENFSAIVVSTKHMELSWSESLKPRRVYVYYNISTRAESTGDYLVVISNTTTANITGLSPYSSYSISITAKPLIGGYWSETTSIISRTAEDAPSAAPIVDIGWFRYEMASCETPLCPVRIYWKPVPAPHRNGIILGYEIRDVTTGSLLASLTGNDVISVTSGLVNLSRADDHVISVTSFTSVGSSPAAKVYVPAANKNAGEWLEVFAEWNADSTSVTVHWLPVNTNRTFNSFTVFYCIGSNQQELQHCSKPSSQTVGATLSNLPIIITNLSSSSRARLELYGVSANSGSNYSTGLSPAASCVYSYNALPRQPTLSRVHSQPHETHMEVEWNALQCGGYENNKGRVLAYNLRYQSVSNPDKSGSFILPSNVTWFNITGLQPDTKYNVTLYATSRAGNGPADVTQFATSKAETSVVLPATLVAVISITIIVIVVLFLIIRRKCKRIRRKLKIIVPQPHSIDDSNKYSSSSNNNNNFVSHVDQEEHRLMTEDDGDGSSSRSSNSNSGGTSTGSGSQGSERDFGGSKSRDSFPLLESEVRLSVAAPVDSGGSSSSRSGAGKSAASGSGPYYSSGDNTASYHCARPGGLLGGSQLYSGGSTHSEYEIQPLNQRAPASAAEAWSSSAPSSSSAAASGPRRGYSGSYSTRGRPRVLAAAQAAAVAAPEYSLGLTIVHGNGLSSYSRAASSPRSRTTSASLGFSGDYDDYGDDGGYGAGGGGGYMASRGAQSPSCDYCQGEEKDNDMENELYSELGLPLKPSWSQHALNGQSEYSVAQPAVDSSNLDLSASPASPVDLEQQLQQSGKNQESSVAQDSDSNDRTASASDNSVQSYSHVDLNLELTIDY